MGNNRIFYYKTNSTTQVFEIHLLDNEVLKKIKSFSELINGWDYGLGVPASKETIDYVIEIYKQLNRIHFEVDVSPRTDGGITLIFSIQDHFVDIDVKPCMRLNIREEVGYGVDYKIDFQKEDVTIAEIENLLEEIYKKCSLSEPSTSINTYSKKNDFNRMYSRPWMAEYPSLPEIVQLRSPVQSATI